MRAVVAGFLLLAACFSTAWADEITVSARVSKTEVQLEEKLIFSVVIAGPIRGTPKLQWTSFEGFQVLSTSQSQQIQIKDGESKQALVLAYTLAPKDLGAHKIGPVTVEYQGKQYQTQPIEVKVVEENPSEEIPNLKGGITL